MASVDVIIENFIVRMSVSKYPLN